MNQEPQEKIFKMNPIKKIIKGTRVFQYIRCKEEFDRIRNRNPEIKGNMKAVYSYKSKIDQIKKILSVAELDTSCKFGFFYSIDDTVIPYFNHHRVDNMPFDYSVVLDNSLNELRCSNPELIDLLINYVKSVSNKLSDEEIRESMLRMIDEHPKTLRDALQRILFWNQLLWQTGHKLIGLSRLDKLLEPYEPDEKLLMNFLETLHLHYNYKSSAMVGDTGQIIILGGLEADGSYFCNEYTYSLISVLEKLNLPDPKILLRVSDKMPKELLKLACECISTGCGSPLLSNDDVVIPALKEFGYRDDAYNYAVSACWEPLIIGKSLEQNNLYDIEFGSVFADMIIKNEVEPASFEELYKAYKDSLRSHLNLLRERLDGVVFEENPIMSVSLRSCRESHIDISQGGADYNNYGLLSVGLASAVDSLLNIKHFVFDSHLYNYKEVKEALAHDYKGYDKLKDDFGQKKDGYGTNCAEAIELTNDIMNFTSECLSDYRNRFGGKVKFGLSSPAYVNGGCRALATADGRCSKEPFATHISRSKPQPLTDIVEFAGALSYKGNKANGDVVDMIVQPSLIKENFDKFLMFIRATIRTGFFQLQFNVLTYEQLLDAKEHPEKYPNLIVRVWGFSAYFNDLPEAYKDVLISRAKESFSH